MDGHSLTMPKKENKRFPVPLLLPAVFSAIT